MQARSKVCALVVMIWPSLVNTHTGSFLLPSYIISLAENKSSVIIIIINVLITGIIYYTTKVAQLAVQENFLN